MDDRIDRLTNIKAIGWTTLVIFGIGTLGIIFQIIGTYIFDDTMSYINQGQEEFNEMITEMKSKTDQLRVNLLIAGTLTTLTAIGSWGLIKLKKWGLTLYQSLTISIIIFMLAGLIYYVYNVRTQIDEEKIPAFEFEMTEKLRTAQHYTTVGYGTFILLFSWLLTRVNIFLSKTETRRELR